MSSTAELLEKTPGATPVTGGGPGLVVDRLVKRFEGKTAVNEVSFDVAEGEFLVLVGPSGCGKTTTLRLVAGLEEITSGEIRLGGQVVNEYRPRDRDVAMVFQDYAIFPHLSVFENIAYGLRSRKAPRRVINERVPAAARTFRIEELLKRKPRQLSGGQRQRVALARALVRDASLYLYDEPLSNLDAQLRHQAREDILTLHREKRMPTIYVTHDQSEAMALGDRIAVMRDGRIQQIGTGADLYYRPDNRFVAYFVGSPTINFFDVSLRVGDDGVTAVNRGFTVELPASKRDLLQPYDGQTVTMGIRPEDVHVPKMAPFEVTEANTVPCVVNTIEPTATGSTVYFSTVEEEPQDLVASLKVRMPMSYLDQEVPMAVNLERAHLFDPETELALRGGGAP